MKRDAVSNYHARMQRVLDHVDRHLDGDLSVDALAGVAAFSRHHFQRQFASMFGLSVHRYVQLVRMKRASYRLAFHRSEPVLGIALDSGFEGPEAFARAFRRHFDQSPSGFRQAPGWEPWHAALAPLDRARSRQMTSDYRDGQVRIVDFPETRVAALAHRGAPTLIGDTLRRFIAWRREAGLTPEASATFNIFHCDPDETPPEDYRIDICAATDRPILPTDAGVIEAVIPAGRCAVLRQTGSSDDLRAAARFLYGEWLPRSGHETRDFPLFVQRVRFFPEVPEHEAVTDLFLPLR